MHDDRSLVEARLRRVLDERVRPAVHPGSVPLRVDVWHAPGEPVPVAEGLAAEPEPIEVGARWGAPWGTISPPRQMVLRPGIQASSAAAQLPGTDPAIAHVCPFLSTMLMATCTCRRISRNGYHLSVTRSASPAATGSESCSASCRRRASPKVTGSPSALVPEDRAGRYSAKSPVSQTLWACSLSQLIT